MNTFKQFLKDEDGATAIEYALIVGLVAVVIIVALSVLGGEIAELFTALSGKVGDVTTSVDDIVTGGTTP